MWTQFWQTSQQAANAWRTSPSRAAAPALSLIQQSQPLPLQSAAPHGQAAVPSIDVSRAALSTPFSAAPQSGRPVAISARSAALSFRSGQASARTQQAINPYFIQIFAPHTPAGSSQANCRVCTWRPWLRQGNSGSAALLAFFSHYSLSDPFEFISHEPMLQCSRIQEAYGWQVRKSLHDE
jgi:hypothetical protein